MPMAAEKAGNWSVMTENKTDVVCARYMFSAAINISYSTILGKVGSTHNS